MLILSRNNFLEFQYSICGEYRAFWIIAADIYDKYVAGDLEGALDAQFTLAPLRIACGMGTFPAVIKEGLVQEGIPVGKCLAPIAELKPEEKEKLHQVLVDMKLV